MVYLIGKAAQTLGSVDAVRAALSAKPCEFEPWRTGAIAPPRPVYERLVNLVISEQDKLIERLQRERGETDARMMLTVRLPF